MSGTLLTAGRGLMLVSNLLYSGGSFMADWNETHIHNPKWPGKQPPPCPSPIPVLLFLLCHPAPSHASCPLPTSATNRPQQVTHASTTAKQ